MKANLIRFLPALALAAALSACQPNRSAPSISGTIETDEARVASRYGGRVERILAQEGEGLSRGQTIVELAAAELHARRDQIEAQLAEAEAGPRKEEIATAKAEWEAQLAQADLARLERKRAEELFATRTLSETERDRAVSNEQALEKSVAAARSRYDLLLAGTRPERIAQAKAQLAELDTQLVEMKISAPTNCLLEVLSVKVGDVVAPNQTVATLLLTNHLWVRVFAPEPWLGHIKLGDAVRVRVDSFADKDFAGSVEPIARSGLFQQANRSNHRPPAVNGRTAPGAVVHQNGGGFDLPRQTNRSSFARVQREIERLGRLHRGPGRQGARPVAHGRRRVRLLKFPEDRRRNHDLAEQAGQGGFRAAQNEVVQRRLVRDDDAHAGARVLSSVARSASKSAAE